MRLFEFGTVYRYEKSGVVHGLTRVRGLTQDDAHIYTTREDMKEELTEHAQLRARPARATTASRTSTSSCRPRTRRSSSAATRPGTRRRRRSRRSPRHPAWSSSPTRAEPRSTGRRSRCRRGTPSAAPGRCPPIQLDFNLPERFELEYTAADGTRQRPVMIHRALFGSIERFFGVLTEHYAGAFPVWLSPGAGRRHPGRRAVRALPRRDHRPAQGGRRARRGRPLGRPDAEEDPQRTPRPRFRSS